MSRFVRASKFRHMYGTAAKRDGCYDNLRISISAWDTNMVKANGSYISINWNAGGGGAFAVLPLENVGRQVQEVSLFNGHSGTVLDTDFSPFNDRLIASGAEDSKVMIWNIPEGGLEENQSTPAVTLNGHRRKIGHVLFHPTAANVLASTSADQTVKLWDVEHGVEKGELTGFGEIIQSLSWNYNGSLLATTCKDKKIRIHDVRSNEVVQIGDSHQGMKGSRVVWLGDTNRACTTGFSRSSERQVFLWDTANLAADPLKQLSIDSSAGIMMPFYDADTHVLFLAGKGDGNIRYYEYENDDLFLLSEYKSSEPQRGMCFMPKRALDVSKCEVARAFKVTSKWVEPISFTVPRKADFFQADLFPDTTGDTPSLTAEAFFAGKNADPILISLEHGFTSATRPDLVVTPSQTSTLTPKASSGSLGGGGAASTPASSSSPHRQPSPSPLARGSSGASEDAGEVAALKKEITALKTQVEEAQGLRRENEELKGRLAEVETLKGMTLSLKAAIQEDAEKHRKEVARMEADHAKVASNFAESVSRIAALEKEILEAKKE